MNLSELKQKSSQEILALAESMGLDDISRKRKQDLIFSILKAHAKGGEEISGDGTLELLQDGYGFLRAEVNSYQANPDDIYVPPGLIRRGNLRTGDTTPLHDISAPECQWCAQTTTDTTTTYTTGGWAANAWHTNTNPTNTTTTPNTTTTNTYTTTLTTTQRTPDIYQPGHFQRFTYIEKATFEITVRWDGNRWLISEVVPTPTTPRPDWLPPVAQTPAPTSQPPTTTPPSQPPAPTPPAPQAPDGTPSNGSAPSQSTGPDTTAPGTTGSPSTDRSTDEEEPTGAPEPTNPADAYAR